MKNWTFFTDFSSGLPHKKLLDPVKKGFIFYQYFLSCIHFEHVIGVIYIKSALEHLSINISAFEGMKRTINSQMHERLSLFLCPPTEQIVDV